MDFLAFLEDYESQDVSAVKDIIESRSTMNDNVLKEAFNSEYPSKREALFNVENYFTDYKTAPVCVDTRYVKENLSEIKEQINSLSEGDIRIIIHNHEDGKKSEVEVAEEGATPKRRPGRPKGSKGKKAVQTDFTKAPKGTTAIIYDEDETDKDSTVIEEEKAEESLDDTLFDKDTKSKAESKEQIDEEDDEIVESNIKWSDIVDAVSDEEEGKEPENDSIDDKLIKDLVELDLTDEELKEVVDSVTEENRGEKITQALEIIRKINHK